MGVPFPYRDNPSPNPVDDLNDWLVYYNGEAEKSVQHILLQHRD
jgi:hypothetical protein